jgi:hypothetical protein
MILFIRYLQAVTKRFIDQWNRFWFMAGPTLDVSLARIALGVLAAVYAAYWWFELSSWIVPNGLLNSSVSRFLIGDQVAGTGSISRLSLLYWFDSPVFVQLYLVITILCSLALAAGLGGRAMAVSVWGLILGIVHRVPMLQGAGDLLFTGLLGYLVVDPGKIRSICRMGLHDRAERWTASLAIRLMQCHLLIWLLISFVSHLAEPMWWAGSAAWWLASAQLSPWYQQHFLSDKPYLINLLSHAFLLLHLVSVGLLMVRYGRPLAIVAAGLTGLGIGGLAGDWLYATAFILCTAAFWGIACREFRELVSENVASIEGVSNEQATVTSSSRSRNRRASKR